MGESGALEERHGGTLAEVGEVDRCAHLRREDEALILRAPIPCFFVRELVREHPGRYALRKRVFFKP